ncbi:MAG: hypothetical protein ACFFBD_07440 [Candidatus Hodarchaeota archaeon]
MLPRAVGIRRSSIMGGQTGLARIPRWRWTPMAIRISATMMPRWMI